MAVHRFPEMSTVRALAGGSAYAPPASQSQPDVRPLGLPLVNADLIAGDLDTPDAAQRARQAAAQAAAERQLLVTRGDAFCMETGSPTRSAPSSISCAMPGAPDTRSS
ncbi:hypothetical protein FHP25_07710 [Vineibacter terrae]|uniref:Uncharacterized protein n=1 Tax=Vineibacter terrae TaxID=2586908 RepID=A0A5C8PRS4_9HYPH|nr:hypothetical protein [Vineibacter terrae]TXL78868.1 hypothetical protein FHP25_07710 [Vineibacter terrae]